MQLLHISAHFSCSFSSSWLQHFRVSQRSLLVCSHLFLSTPSPWSLLHSKHANTSSVQMTPVKNQQTNQTEATKKAYSFCFFSTHSTSDSWMGFLPIKQFCDTRWMSCSFTQFYHCLLLEKHHYPQVKGSVLEDGLSPPPASDASSKSHLSPVLWPKGCKLAFPQPHLCTWPFARAAHRTQRKTYLYLSACFIMRTILRNTDKQPDKEIHMVRPGKVLCTGASYPVKLRITTLLACSYIYQPINSQDSTISRFLCRPHHLHDWSWTQFLVPLAFQKDGWWGWTLQMSDYGPGSHGGWVVKKQTNKNLLVNAGRKILWRKKWQPMPVFLSEKSHGQRILVGYGVAKESDMT